MKKTVLVTGVSSGIGLATARYFSTQGWRVIGTVRDQKKANVLKKLLNIETYVLDVVDTHAISQIVEKIIQSVGKLDVLVNNAGLGLEAPLETAIPKDIEEIVRVNVLGVFQLTRAVVPHFRTNGEGVIINISSMGGRTTFPFYALYHGTKWAVEGFSESLQYELAPFNIKVKIIEPGIIATPFYEKMTQRAGGIIPDAYKSMWKHVAGSKNIVRKFGNQPDKVAQTIYRAATDGSTRLRYSVGIDAWFLIFLRRFIPESLLFFLIRKSIRG